MFNNKSYKPLKIQCWNIVMNFFLNSSVLQSKRWEYMVHESTGVIIRAIGRRLVEATGDPREGSWFRQNLAIAIQRGNAFSILSAGRERF